jgi:threonine aldolase
MNKKRGFASDNNSPVHPKIMQAMLQVNEGHTIGYGDDWVTEKAVQAMKKEFGQNCHPFFVFNGTAANVLGLKALTHSYHSVICGDTSHIEQDECGALEKFTGCKTLIAPTKEGKLTIPEIAKHLYGLGFEHHSQPKVISITQTTEMGTVYTPEEIRAIANFAHQNHLLLHMDGARLCNAAASLEVPLRAITSDCGVDALSFGGTKNGAMLGEAIIFFQPELAENFKYYRKQGMQLGSKMRYISAQFLALLTDELWRENALHANKMATMLSDKIKQFPQIRITQKVQANGVFAIVPADIIPALQKAYFFYEWDEHNSEVRWMTSFDTQPEDIDNFVELLRKLLS